MPIIYRDKCYKNIDGKNVTFRGAFFIQADAPIYWVDEEQYLYPPPIPPTETEKRDYHDEKGVLKPDLTRIYYWREGSLQSFYINYALTQRTGGGSLAMRVDPLSEVEWSWNVGSATTDETIKFANQRAESIGLSSTRLAPSAGAPLDYFQTNTPTPPLHAASSIDAKKPYAQYGGIAYYKRFKTREEETPPIKRNLPPDPGPPRIPDEKSLEISRLYRKKVKRQTLEKSAGARDDAGTVMAKKIRHILKNAYPFAGDKLSANTYVRSMFGSVPDFKEVDITFRESWKTHSAGNSKTNERLPDQISQEWCHLHGHGDGGPEVYENFVAGSKHCNTEQLAIELGQRIARPGDLTARVTAYLFESRGHGNPANLTADNLKAAIRQLAPENTETAVRLVDQLLSQPSGGAAAPVTSAAAGMDVDVDVDLDTDPGRTPSGTTAGAEPRAPASQADRRQRKSTKRQRSPEATAGQNPQPAIKPKIDITEQLEQEIKAFLSASPASRADCNVVIAALQSLYVPLPIARWMRYKIYHNDVKIFEHVYDGQSESFDANEGNILKLAVEHAVAHALALADPESKILERYNARLAAQCAAHARASASSTNEDAEMQS